MGSIRWTKPQPASDEPVPDGSDEPVSDNSDESIPGNSDEPVSDNSGEPVSNVPKLHVDLEQPPANASGHRVDTLSLWGGDTAAGPRHL